jgi:hypothetical protein
MPPPAQDNTTYTKNKHPCLKRDSNPRSSVRAIEACSTDIAVTGSPITIKIMLMIIVIIIIATAEAYRYSVTHLKLEKYSKENLTLAGSGRTTRSAQAHAAGSWRSFISLLGHEPTSRKCNINNAAVLSLNARPTVRHVGAIFCIFRTFYYRHFA